MVWSEVMIYIYYIFDIIKSLCVCPFLERHDKEKEKENQTEKQKEKEKEKEIKRHNKKEKRTKREGDSGE